MRAVRDLGALRQADGGDTTTAMEGKGAEDSHVREAADWFTRLNARSVSVSDLEGFRAWAADPARRRAYDAIEDVWRATGRLHEDPRIAASLGRALSGGNRARRPWIAPVLVAILACVVPLVWIATRPPVFRTDAGERRSVRLADGSRLQLDTATVVEVSLGRERRTLRLLKGQALFDVAHDRSRPFRVRAGDATVTATGTRFDVRLESGQAQVTLVEGGVLVEHEEGGRWRLAPGQRLRTSAHHGAAVTAVDLGAALGWTEGRLVFDAIPLAEAARDINRYGDRPVRIARGVDATLPISGTFDTGDSAAFAEAVAQLHDLRVRVLRDELVLAPGPSGPV